VQHYRAECAKFGAMALVDDTVCKKAEEVGKACDVTAFESHLCRSLKKEEAEKGDSIAKYASLFAHVPTADVEPHLWAAADVFLKARTIAAGTAPPAPPLAVKAGTGLPAKSAASSAKGKTAKKG
jgi:hypothetical protein